MSPVFKPQPTVTLERKPSGGYTLITYPQTLQAYRVDLTEEQYTELKQQMVWLDSVPQRKPLTRAFADLRAEFGQGWRDDNAD